MQPHRKSKRFVYRLAIASYRNLHTNNLAHIKKTCMIKTVRDTHDKQTINFLTGEPEMSDGIQSMLRKLKMTLERQTKALEETKAQIEALEKLANPPKK